MSESEQPSDFSDITKAAMIFGYYMCWFLAIILLLIMAIVYVVHPATPWEWGDRNMMILMGVLALVSISIGYGLKSQVVKYKGGLNTPDNSSR